MLPQAVDMGLAWGRRTWFFAALAPLSRPLGGCLAAPRDLHAVHGPRPPAALALQTREVTPP